MLSGSPKYKEKSLPIPAPFVSNFKEMRVQIEPVETESGADGIVKRKRNTGLRVKFEDHRLLVLNALVLKKLLAHKNFNNPRHGFFIDTEDPTGFWRTIGAVEEKTVTVVNSEHSPKKIEVGKAALEKLSKVKDEEFKPLIRLK